MIIRKRSRIIIENPNDLLKRSLGFELGVWNKAAFKHSFLAVHKFDNGNIAVPADYPISKISYHMPNAEVKNDYTSLGHERYEIRMKDNVGWHPTREDYARIQERAFNFLLANRSKSRKMLNLGTGVGKTFVAIKYICETSARPIVIVDQLSLALQWIEDGFLKFTNLQESDIMLLNETKTCEKIIHFNEFCDKKVYITTYKTIASLLKKNEDYVSMLFSRLKISTKVFDEAHLEMNALFKIDSSADVNETLYLTATPGRSVQEENKILEYILPFHTTMSSKNDVAKYHNVLLVTYKTTPSIDIEFEISSGNKHGFSAAKWCTFIINNHFELFASGLLNILEDSFKKSEKKSAILFKTQEMLLAFRDYIVKMKPEWSENIGLFTNLNGNTGSANKKKRLELEKLIILTTDSSFVSGIDTKDLRLVINTISYTSDIVAEQVLGRIRPIEGKEILYVDYCDIGFAKIRKQKNNRMTVYNRIAKKIYLPPAK